MRTHYLKTWPVFYGSVALGKKSFEVRNDDREFEEGDILVLLEWDPKLAAEHPSNPSAGYTGKPEIRGIIEYVLLASDCPAGALNQGFAVLGVQWEGVAHSPCGLRGGE
jgi:hypothetical protein